MRLPSTETAETQHNAMDIDDEDAGSQQLTEGKQLILKFINRSASGVIHIYFPKVSFSFKNAWPNSIVYFLL